MPPLPPAVHPAVREERERAKRYRLALLRMDSPLEHDRWLWWAAGFLEGEGWFGMAPSGLPRISAGQVQREPLERLQRAYGGNLRLRRLTKLRAAGSNAQDIWVWTLHSEEALRLCRDLWPLMSPRRQQQIEKALGEGTAAQPAEKEEANG